MADFPQAATAKVDHLVDVNKMVGGRVSRPTPAAFALLITAAVPCRQNHVGLHVVSSASVAFAGFDTFSISLWNSLSTLALKSVPI